VDVILAASYALLEHSGRTWPGWLTAPRVLEQTAARARDESVAVRIPPPIAEPSQHRRAQAPNTIVVVARSVGLDGSRRTGI
jgi:hypothetical protein